MLVGRYTDGRDVLYNESDGSFAIGTAPVTAAQVREYDTFGQITWVNDEVAAWARGLANVAAPAPPSTGNGKGWFSRLPMWGKAIFVILYPISIPYGIWAMWKTQRYTQPVRIALTAAGVLVFVVAATTSGSGSDTAPSAAESGKVATQSDVKESSSPAVSTPAEAPPQVTPAPAPEPEPEPEPDYAAGAPTPSSVQSALKEADFQVDSVVVDGGSVTVSRDPGTQWDENSMVESSGRDALKVFAVVFKNAQVQDVTYVSTTEFTDQYGKTASDEAVKITYTRATADKIDWKGLQDRAWADWKAPYNIANYYVFHPGIWKNLDERIPIEGGTGF